MKRPQDKLLHTKTVLPMTFDHFDRDQTAGQEIAKKTRLSAAHSCLLKANSNLSEADWVSHLPKGGRDLFALISFCTQSAPLSAKMTSWQIMTEGIQNWAWILGMLDEISFQA